MTVIKGPYPVFMGADGTPIENGKIYIGDPGLDPKTNQKAVYWDAAMTNLVTQPMTTVAGVIQNSGAAAVAYTTGDYSISVYDSNDQLVETRLSHEVSETGAGLDPGDDDTFKVADGGAFVDREISNWAQSLVASGSYDVGAIHLKLTGAIREISSSITLASNDRSKVIVATADLTINVPVGSTLATSANAGWWCTIRGSGGNATVVPASGTIDGKSSILVADGSSVELFVSPNGAHFTLATSPSSPVEFTPRLTDEADTMLTTGQLYGSYTVEGMICTVDFHCRNVSPGTITSGTPIVLNDLPFKVAKVFPNSLPYFGLLDVIGGRYFGGVYVEAPAVASRRVDLLYHAGNSYGPLQPADHFDLTTGTRFAVGGSFKYEIAP